MDGRSPRDGMWFAAKRFGYGAGLPVAWQGWALLAGYVLAALAVGPLVALPYPAAKAMTIAGFALLTIGFVAVARRRTRGGWKWRWGGED
jgi:hypothetical protein